MIVRIMLDLETLDTSPTAALLSIGACTFAPGRGLLGQEFYTAVTPDDQQEKYGRTVSPKTLEWWGKQSEEARKVFHDPAAMGFVDALRSFDIWVKQVTSEQCSGIEVWGNGSDFDNIILGGAFEAAQMPKPWSYGGNRCYRTLKNIAPNLLAGQGFARGGTHHNALDDAIYQAQYASLWLQLIGVK